MTTIDFAQLETQLSKPTPPPTRIDLDQLAVRLEGGPSPDEMAAIWNVTPTTEEEKPHPLELAPESTTGEVKNPAGPEAPATRKPGLLARFGKQLWNKAVAGPAVYLRTQSPVARLGEDLDVIAELKRTRETGETFPSEMDRFNTAVARVQQRRQAEAAQAAHAQEVPPAKGLGEKAVDIGAGIGAFAGQVAATRRLLPAKTPTPVVWEAQNLATGGQPGTGAVMAGGLGGIGKIPAKTVAGRAGKVAAEAATLGGLAAAEGGSWEDIFTSAGIGLLFGSVREARQFWTGLNSPKAIREYQPPAGAKMTPEEFRDWSHQQARTEAHNAARRAMQNPDDPEAQAEWQRVRAKYASLSSEPTESSSVIGKSEPVPVPSTPNGKGLSPTSENGSVATVPAGASAPTPVLPVAGVTPERATPGQPRRYASESKPPEFRDEAKNRRRNLIQNELASGGKVGPDLLEEFRGEPWANEILGKPQAAAPVGPAGERELEYRAQARAEAANLPARKMPKGKVDLNSLERRLEAQAPLPPKAAPVTPEAAQPLAGKPAEPAQPTGIVSLPVASIKTDPERFQFKREGVEWPEGITRKMAGVEQWNPIAAGNVLVWEDKSGQRWVVDGHHRLALAKRLGVKNINAYLIRESDGFSDTEALTAGAMSNLAAGNGTALDAARLFRAGDVNLEQLKDRGVNVKSQIVAQGLAMRNLSDEVFRMAVDGKIPPAMAAVIGENTTSPVQQRQIADIIAGGNVESAREAELLARTIDAAPVLSKSEETLFGTQTTEKSLYLERARILHNVEKILRENQKVFGTLARKAGMIEQAENVLAKESNLAAKQRADEILYLLERLANTKGPVSEALNHATIEYAKQPTKAKLAEVTTDLLRQWEQKLTVENVGGLHQELPEQGHQAGPVNLLEKREPPPGHPEGGFVRIPGAVGDVATEAKGILRNVGLTPARALKDVAVLINRNLRTAPTYFKKLGNAGKKIAEDLHEITFRVTKRHNNDMLDLRRVYTGLGKEGREKIAKVLNGRLPRDKQSADTLRRADRLGEILDRSMNEAANLGLTRRVRGVELPIKGTGAAYPQVPNAEGQRFLREAQTKGKGSKRVFAWAQEQVDKGRYANVDEAITALQRVREDSIRGLNPYLERERVELPAEYIEWDGAEHDLLQQLLERNWLTVEGSRQWGVKDKSGQSFPRLNSRIEQIHQEFGPDHAQRVKSFIQISFGARSPASPEAVRISNAIRSYQFATKIGLSPLGTLRNMMDRIAKGFTISPLSTLEATVEYPPFVNGLLRYSRKIEEQMIRRGATFGRAALSDQYEAGSALQKLLATPFTESERGNQVFIGLVSYHKLMHDLAILEKQRPGTLGTITDKIMGIFGQSKAQAAERVGPKLAAKIGKGEAVTDDDISKFLHDAVSKYTFPMLLDSKPLWYDRRPFVKLAAQFKTWPLRQLNMIYEDVLKYTIKTGDPTRLVGFVVGTALAGELYNIARDAILHKDESLTSQLQKPSEERRLGKAIINDLLDGGVVGVISDFVYGLWDWALGVTYRTSKNVSDTAKYIKESPGLFGPALEKLLTQEFQPWKQAKGIWERWDAAHNANNLSVPYTHWRAAAFEWKDTKKAPGLLGKVDYYADRMLWGRTEYEIGPHSLAYELAARQVVAGDLDEAAKFLKYILHDCKTAAERKKTLTAIAQSMNSRSPLGPIAEKDRHAFLMALPLDQRREVAMIDRKFEINYRQALRKAQGLKVGEE